MGAAGHCSETAPTNLELSAQAYSVIPIACIALDPNLWSEGKTSRPVGTNFSTTEASTTAELEAGPSMKFSREAASLPNHRALSANERILLSQLQRFSPLSRAELSRRAGLALPTVSRLSEQLLRDGLFGVGPIDDGRAVTKFGKLTVRYQADWTVYEKSRCTSRDCRRSSCSRPTTPARFRGAAQQGGSCQNHCRSAGNRQPAGFAGD